MSLIRCPECKKKISSDSKKCIHCGYPLKEVPVEEIEKKPILKNKKLMIILSVSIVIIGIILWLILSLVKVPVIAGLDAIVAKEKVNSKELVPKIKYINNEKIGKEIVIKTKPEAGKLLRKGKTVTIYVSKGPKKIEAETATITWNNIYALEEDNWDFYTPFIEDGYLKIECKATFSTDFKWNEEGMGEASLNENFNGKVPFKVNYSKMNVKAGKPQNIFLKIPIKALYNEKPTEVYVNLYYTDYYGDQGVYKVFFNMVWKD